MPCTRTAAVVVLIGLSLVGATAPVIAFDDPGRSGHSASPALSARTAAHATADRAADGSNASVNVTVGGQLSTVLQVTSDDVRTEVETTLFDVRFEASNESERAELVANRSAELRERAADIRANYDAATNAFRAGDLNRSEYARRLATLNARATNVLVSFDRLQRHSRTVSDLELRVAGVNRTALRAEIDDLEPVTGVGTSALLRRFTGASRAEIELETDGGLSIEVEDEDGERSREVERERDDDPAITVDHATARDTARAQLGAPPEGTWTLQESSVHEDSGYYKFEFELDGANATGEAEVRVDGSSGEVFRLESEIESGESDDEAAGDGRGDDDADELDLAVVGGTPAPNATVTIRVLGASGPAQNASVYLNDRRIGTTDSNGTVAVTLPLSDDATVTARNADSEGELEFEFEERDDEVSGSFDVSASLADGTVTVTVSHDGSGVANATVSANGRSVGATAADGIVAFAVGGDTEELEIEIVKGEFEAELAYVIQNGSLTRGEDAREGDGEDDDGKADDEREDEEDAQEDEGEGDGQEDEDEQEGKDDDEEDDQEDDQETDDTDEDDDAGEDGDDRDDDEQEDGAEDDTGEDEEQEDERDEQEDDREDEEDEQEDDEQEDDTEQDEEDDEGEDSEERDDERNAQEDDERDEDRTDENEDGQEDDADEDESERDDE